MDLDLLLPWITLAFLYAATYARLTRAGMLETMNEDYVRTARAKGLPERDVIVKHGLRSALTPILTIFGLDLGLLLGGAILTETTFSLPASGKYAVDGDHEPRPAEGARRDARRLHLHHRREPHRRHPLRRHRPPGDAREPPRRAPPIAAPTVDEADGTPHAFLEVRDLRSTSRPTTVW